MKRKPRVYISGPIKGVREAEVLFSLAAQKLDAAGYEPVSPYDCPPICNDHCRHDERPDYDCNMRGGITALMSCDVVALLSGWQGSNGARLEQFVAASVGIPTAPLEDWLPARKALDV